MNPWKVILFWKNSRELLLLMMIAERLKKTKTNRHVRLIIWIFIRPEDSLSLRSTARLLWQTNSVCSNYSYACFPPNRCKLITTPLPAGFTVDLNVAWSLRLAKKPKTICGIRFLRFWLENIKNLFLLVFFVDALSLITLGNVSNTNLAVCLERSP